MSATVQLDVPVLLPEVNDCEDRCVVLLANALRATPGVLRVHLPGDFAVFRFCIHHDPALIDAAEIERLARREAARVTEEIGYLLWAVGWIEDEHTARETREALRRLSGVLGAETTPQGAVRVEYDRHRIDAGVIERSLHALGIGAGTVPSVGAPSRRGSHRGSATAGVVPA